MVQQPALTAPPSDVRGFLLGFNLLLLLLLFPCSALANSNYLPFVGYQRPNVSLDELLTRRVIFRGSEYDIRIATTVRDFRAWHSNSCMPRSVTDPGILAELFVTGRAIILADRFLNPEMFSLPSQISAARDLMARTAIVHDLEKTYGIVLNVGKVVVDIAALKTGAASPSDLILSWGPDLTSEIPEKMIQIRVKGITESFVEEAEDYLLRAWSTYSRLRSPHARYSFESAELRDMLTFSLAVVSRLENFYVIHNQHVDFSRTSLRGFLGDLWESTGARFSQYFVKETDLLPTIRANQLKSALELSEAIYALKNASDTVSGMAEYSRILSWLKEDVAGDPEFFRADVIDAYRREFEEIGRGNTLDERRIDTDILEQSPAYAKCGPTGGVAIVTDVSGSMGARVRLVEGGVQRKKIEVAKEAVLAVAHRLDGIGTAYSLSAFSSDAHTLLEMQSGPAHLARVKGAVMSIEPEGGTNVGAGLRAGFEQLNQGAGARCAVLMSDGQHNTGGSFDAAVAQFKAKGWPVYTVGFGEEVGRGELLGIARETGGTFWQAEGRNLGSVFLDSGSLCTNTSTTKRVTETMGPGAEVEYTMLVQGGVDEIGGHATWQGSTLDVLLVDPRGRQIPSSALPAHGGRAATGSTYLVFSKRKPEPGTWRLRFFWSEPPPVAEQVNIALTERSNIVMGLVGIENEYPVGAPVQIVLRTGEVVGEDRTPLLEPRMRVQVQKPGPQVVDVIRARSRNLQLLERVVDAATVTVDVHDDGRHGDYRRSDGIFGGVFADTHEPGVYLIRAEVQGRKRDGSWVQREITATFQVGPLDHNPVTAAAVLEAVDLLSQRQNPARSIEAVRSGVIRSAPATLPRPANSPAVPYTRQWQAPTQGLPQAPAQPQQRPPASGPAAAIERLRAQD